jgi:hypothetical protein
VLGLALWYDRDGGDNWRGENWREATAYVMREAGGAQPYPEWAHFAFTYYGGRRVDNGWVIAWRGAGIASRPGGIPFGHALVVHRPSTDRVRPAAPATTRTSTDSHPLPPSRRDGLDPKGSLR